MDTFILPDSIEYLRDYVRDLLNGIIEKEYTERAFSGIMNLEGFIDYIVFEVCSDQYLRTAKTYSLLQHVQNIIEDHKNYLRNLEAINQQNEKIKSAEDFDEESLYHGLHLYLSDMIDRRSADFKIGEQQTDNPSMPEAMSNLLNYDSSDSKERWHGYPISTVYFLQVYTSYLLGIKHTKFVLRSANKNFNAEKARANYERQDHVLEFISSLMYRDSFNNNECDRYIANVINLSRYENTYFRNTLYTYTYHQPDTKERPPFLTGTIPPIFLEAIGTTEAATHCIAGGYLPLCILESGRCTQNMNIRKPYLFMNDYAKIFASGDGTQRHTEELRYYAVQILAATMIHLVKNCPIVSNVTPKDFACFIHNRYNIVDEMLHQAAIHNESGFNAKMLYTMRSVSRNHKDQYGFND